MRLNCWFCVNGSMVVSSKCKTRSRRDLYHIHATKPCR